MNTRQKSYSASPRNTLVQKLHPKRFRRMSGLMAAVLGFVLDAQFSRPSIAQIVVTSDGFVLARVDDEVGTNHFIGSYADLVRNWLGLIGAAGLTMHERIAAEALFAPRSSISVGFAHKGKRYGK